MRTTHLAGMAATAALAVLATGAARAATPTFYGPSAYVSQADAPFHASDFSHFYLENVEDESINTLGLSVTGPSLCIAGQTPGCFPAAGGLTDSVGNGGDGTKGRSIWTAGSTTVTFDKDALGQLPTFAGLVWTDGLDPINFEAFDENGLSLGGLFNEHHADGTFGGTIGDDRFYGLTYAGGISKMTITDSSGLEVDDIQYGFGAVGKSGPGVPEPGTWALMIAGFAGLGAVLRRRRTAAA